MIPARVGKRIWDAKDAGEAIQRYTAGMDAGGFRSNDLVRSAVERQFEIIGEALNVVRRDSAEASAGIPKLPQWVGLRNFLAHRYDDVRDDVLFRIVHDDLPPLLIALAELLGGTEPP